MATEADRDHADAVTEAARWLAAQGIDVPPVVGAASVLTTHRGDVPHAHAEDDDDADHHAEGDADDEDAFPKSTQRPVGGAGRRPPRQSSGPEDPETAARGLVLRKLTAQARTRHELDRALKAKDIPDEVAGHVLDRMEEVGLVDDAAFARDWVGSRQQRRQLSRQALRHELQHRGVGRDEIEDALSAVDGDDEYSAAVALAGRKARGTTGLPREVRYRRLAGALARRGFSSGLTTRVVGEVLDLTPD